MNLKLYWSVINSIRGIPAYISYVVSNEKDKIDKDIKRNVGEKMYERYGKIFCLNYLLSNEKPFRNIFYFRMKSTSKILTKLISLFYLPQKDIEISGDIAGGLQIWHGYGTVIVAHSIGENFTAYQGATIGRNSKYGVEIDMPIIGDNVTVYTNAVVAGGIHIGSNVSIGAGSVVMKDISTDSVVISNATIIKEKI